MQFHNTTLATSTRGGIRSAAAIGLLAVGSLGALVPTAAAAPGVISPAATSIVTRSTSGAVELQAGTATTNDVQVFLESGILTITDTAGLTAGTGCTLVNSLEVQCGTGVTNVGLFLGDQDDVVRVQTGIATTVFGEAGNDFFHGGLVAGADSQAFYDGGTGADTVSYASADRFVVVTVSTSLTGNDGRPDDVDNVQASIETVIGTRFPDTLTGDGLANILTGGDGADTITGNKGADTLDGGKGADVLTGGAGVDLLKAEDSAKDTTIDCSSGKDTAAVDAGLDVAVNCETLN